MKRHIFVLFLVVLFLGFVAASDWSIFQGQYFIGDEFQVGTFEFDFNVYDDSSSGSLVFSYSENLTTGVWGQWYIEIPGVGDVANNVSEDYFMEVVIDEVIQTPRRRLTVNKFLRKDTDESLTGNLNLTSANITTTGTGVFDFLGTLSNRIMKLFVTDINVSNNVVVGGNVTANAFIGDGGGLTGIMHTSANNDSWNQSYASALYADATWGYNQTTPAIAYVDGQGFYLSANPLGFYNSSDFVITDYWTQAQLLNGTLLTSYTETDALAYNGTLRRTDNHTFNGNVTVTGNIIINSSFRLRSTANSFDLNFEIDDTDDKSFSILGGTEDFMAMGVAAGGYNEMTIGDGGGKVHAKGDWDWTKNLVLGSDNLKMIMGGNPADFVMYSDGTNAIIDVLVAIRLGNEMTNYAEFSDTGNLEFYGSGNTILAQGNGIGFGSENLTTTGNITSAFYFGDGSQLTNLPSPDLSAYRLNSNHTFNGDVIISEGSDLQVGTASFGTTSELIFGDPLDLVKITPSEAQMSFIAIDRMLFLDGQTGDATIGVAGFNTLIVSASGTSTFNNDVDVAGNLNVTGSVTFGQTLFVQGMVDADGYLEHSAVYDKEKYGDALDYVQDAEELIDAQGEYDHEADPEFIQVEVQTAEGTEVRASLGDKVAWMRQAVYELKEENDLLKEELCGKDGTYSFCSEVGVLAASEVAAAAEEVVEVVEEVVEDEDEGVVGGGAPAEVEEEVVEEVANETEEVVEEVTNESVEVVAESEVFCEDVCVIEEVCVETEACENVCGDVESCEEVCDDEGICDEVCSVEEVCDEICSVSEVCGDVESCEEVCEEPELLITGEIVKFVTSRGRFVLVFIFVITLIAVALIFWIASIINRSKSYKVVHKKRKR